MKSEVTWWTRFLALVTKNIVSISQKKGNFISRNSEA